MRKWIPFYIILILFIGSCIIQEGNNNALPTPAPPPTDGAPITTESATTPPTLVSELPLATPILRPTATADSTSITIDPPLIAGEAVLITNIQMTSESSGWAIGQQSTLHDHILRTFDAGATWIDISPPQPLPKNTGTFLKATAHFVNNDYAWVVYTQPKMQPMESVQIWYTSNGGIDWDTSDPLPLTGQESYFKPDQFSFVDLMQGWLLVHVDAGMSHDYSELFATTDGGLHWERVSDPRSDGIQSLHNTGVAFGDAQLGWVTKDNLGVLQETFFELTTDGGDSWKIHPLPAPNNFDWQNEFSRCITSEPAFLNQQVGIVLVNCIVTIDKTTYTTKTLTYVYSTPNQGESWQYSQLPSKIDSLLFISDQKGWAFGREIFTTVDGGLSWTSVKTVNWDGQFSFANSLQGWAVARTNEEIALVKTTDGGRTWQILDPQVQ